MAQIQNQNPLDPMENTEFVAQLAQFSQLEQLTNISSALVALDDIQNLIAGGQVFDLLGKEVTVEGKAVVVSDGEAGMVTFDIEADAQVYAYVYDAEGNIISYLDLGELKAGTVEWSWDATDYNEDQVEDGVYAIAFTASDDSGNSVTVSNVQFSGVVTGYTLDSETGEYYLRLGNSDSYVYVALSDITGVNSYSGSNNKSEEEETES
jgi:flagellar basal-body rod modification protein FlgD